MNNTTTSTNHNSEYQLFLHNTRVLSISQAPKYTIQYKQKH
ncbi:hypothetical protein BVRB_4g090480 [Beta vulgaris subsp. vulgaris]|nr:hypothetical protein BVRB_4g090480 [Beta vulgaris subsp. vulgaris]